MSEGGKVGRPRATDPKESKVELRTTEAEKAAWADAAALDGSPNVSAWVRGLIEDRLKAQVRKAKKQTSQNDEEAPSPAEAREGAKGRPPEA